MIKNFYKIAVEHPEGGKKELHISKGFLSLFFLAVLTISSTAFVFLFLSGIYFQEKNSKVVIKALNKRTKFLNLENRKYKEELKKLESKIDSVNILENKVKNIFNIDEIDKKTIEKSKGGIGGPVINVLKSHTLESFFFKPEEKFFHEDVEKVWNETQQYEDKFSTIIDILKNRKGYPYFLSPQWPVEGTVNSGFGARLDPLTGEKSYHEGVDISGNLWTPIRAASAGKVIFSGWAESGYGRSIIIDHGNGYQTVYAHNVSNVVNAGEKVKKGEIIAYLGSTGRSTGPHLHFEVRYRGTPSNPKKFFFN